MVLDAKFIPVCTPALSQREKNALVSTIEDGWISSDGPQVREFETKFSEYVECKYGVAVSSGTAALECALYALGIGSDDEVIIPNFTIVSCAIAVIRLGATPVFAEVDPVTWCIDPKHVESLINERTKCVMAVHMYGHPADIPELTKITKPRGIALLEDAAQVHGGALNGRKCGGLADIATFSFYANKIITTGEGGMVTTSCKYLAERAADYRNLCFTKEKRFLHYSLGNNYRMTNMQAAIGLAQLSQIDQFIEKKISDNQRYRKLLEHVSGLSLQASIGDIVNVFWMHCVVLPEGYRSEEAMSFLLSRGIQTRQFFLGMHAQPALSQYVANKPDIQKYKISDQLHERGIYLPSSIKLTESDINYTSEALLEFLS